jgi:TPR repeat protein
MKVRHTAAILATMVLLSGCRKEGGSPSAPGVGSAVAAPPSASTPAATALASAITGGDVDNPPPFVPPKLTPQEMAEDLWTCTNDWWEDQRSLKPFCQWVLTAWTGDDLAASAKKYKADCDKGDGLACMLAVGGYYLVKSPLRSKLFELAQDEDAKLVIKACELGTPVACTRLASYLGCIDDRYGDAYGCKPRVVGFLQRKGVSGVRALLEPLCAKGDGASCRSIGRILWRDAIKLTLEEKMQSLDYDERACGFGDSSGCGSGAQVIKIIGDAKLAPKAQALAARELAALEGRCLRFGECGHVAQSYLAGEGVTADAAKARGYFARACTYGFEGPDYCIDLADLQAAGKGGPVNAEAARKVYEKECSVMPDSGVLKSYQYGGMAHGCRGLAHLYQEGIGVPKDEKRAYDILKKACVVEESAPVELGLLCLDLARAEIDGRGTPVDLEQGIRRLEDPERRYSMLKAEYTKEMDRAAALRRAPTDAGK